LNILHIFSNWKWTGPAEHALNLALEHQRLGHRVTFACAAPPETAPNSIRSVARERGIEPYTGCRLNKHFSPYDSLQDIGRLASFIRQSGFDVVHTHMPNDHLLAGLAVKLGLTKAVLVRTSYDGSGFIDGIRTRLCLLFLTDGFVTISEKTRDQVLKRRSLTPNKVWTTDIPVDLDRFNPDKVADCRAKFALAPDAVVGGIVARVQTHRRFEVLLEALGIVLREFPGFKFMIIGRGTHIEQIAIKPSQKMGIRTNLIFTGYMKEDFAETLACLDFKIFLVPGSDGSCRAVREAMAMGKPVIVARRGILPELVEHEKHGLVIDDTAENIAEAILFMVEHPEKREEMSRNARLKAQTCFDSRTQAETMISIYKELLTRKARPRWYHAFTRRSGRTQQP
jgi:glycosyltransferase involved in cell wall biosynthesis